MNRMRRVQFLLLYFLLVLLTEESLEINDTASEDKPLHFHPTSGSSFYLTTKQTVYINLSQEFQNYAKQKIQYENTRYFIGVDYAEPRAKTTKLIRLGYYPNMEYLLPHGHNLDYLLFWPLQVDSRYNTELLFWNETSNFNIFQIKVVGLGYPKVTIHLIEMDEQNSTSLLKTEYTVRAEREQRLVDFSFNMVIMIVGVLNAFGIGCVTNIKELKSHLEKKAIPVCIAAGTQYIAIPLLTFGLVKAAQLENEFAVGLLICACIPGGGLGHLIVVITGTANPDLSLVLNCLEIVIVIATAPLWMYSLGQFFKNGEGINTLSTHYVILLCALLIIPYVLGIITRYCKKSASEAILNWLIKPILLLILILFVTLGLYINMYAFTTLDKRTFAVAGIIPVIGFAIGGGLTLVTMQGKPQAKTVAIEAAIMNCALVIAATRFTMPQPDADLASASAIAVLFLTPIPFISMFIFHKIKKKLMGIIKKREFKKEQAEVIMQSFAAITNNALQISGMSPSQIAARRDLEKQLTIDRTLPVSSESSDLSPNKSQTIVNFNSGSTSVEPIQQSNHGNFV